MIKGILFNTEMVRAILAGRKTVTRRVIKPRYRDDEYGWTVCINSYTHLVDDVAYTDGDGACTRSMKPPYQVGDILYIREAWAKDCFGNYVYKADYVGTTISPEWKWRPSIHMPKEAARIWLKVTDVRVERLQDITDEGCKAEGTNLDDWYDFDEWQHQTGDGCAADGIPVVFETLRGFFGSTVWNSTLKSEDEYDKYCWNANPWVFVISFEKVVK